MSLIDTTSLVAPPQFALLGSAPASVTFCSGERADVLGMARRLFGRRLHARELADLAGAPDESEVEVGVYRRGLYLEFSDPTAHRYHGVCQVSRGHGRPIMRIDSLHIRQPSLRGRGLGLRIFSRQATAAAKFGVARIETKAGRREDENGYYTWPRYGFRGSLPRWLRERLPRDLIGAADVLDLMQSEFGRCWWRRHGLTLPVVFDLRAGGRCWQAFQSYRSSRLAVDA